MLNKPIADILRDYLKRLDHRTRNIQSDVEVLKSISDQQRLMLSQLAKEMAAVSDMLQYIRNKQNHDQNQAAVDDDRAT